MKKYRFALRNRLSISVIVDNHADLCKYLDDDKLEVHIREQLDDKRFLLCYKRKDEHVLEHDASNLVIALWTTSSARVHLLNHLYEVKEDRMDTEILYMVNLTKILNNYSFCRTQTQYCTVTLINGAIHCLTVTKWANWSMNTPIIL